jgi:hypothetical protein
VTTTTTTPARRRYALSVRALMVLVLILGGGFGWTVNRANRRAESVDAIRRAKGVVYFDYQYNGQFNPAAKPWTPSWLSAVLREEFFHDVTMVIGSPGMLDFSQCEAKDADAAWEAIQGCDRLQRLRIANPPPGATLSGLLRLKKLLVSTTTPGEGPPIRLATLPSLSEVHFGGPGVNDSITVELAKLPSLSILLLPNTRITDAGLSRICDLPGLEWLSLDHSEITDAGLTSLVRVKALKILDLDGNRGVTDEGMHFLSTNLPHLTKLMVGGSTGVTDAGLLYLARLRDLQALNLGGTGVTDSGLEHLCALKELRCLYLMGTSITDTGLGHVAGLSGLEDLYLDGTQVSDAGLKHLYTLKSIKRLSVTGTAISPEGVAMLKAAFPPSTTIWSGGTPKPRPAAPQAAGR